MGIKGFAQWMQLTFPSSFSCFDPSKYVCDFLYVDFNNYLHLHSRFAQSERQFLSNVQATACKLVLLNRSKESTMITLDGPASISKIPLQLERRHRIMQQGQGNSLKNLLTIPSAFLTPGTLFMRKVEESITRSIKTILKHEQHHQRLLNQRSITLSGPCTIGEAEDKIMTSLQKRWESLTSSTGRMEKRFAIFGCDGDLLVYTIATSPLFVDFINCIPASSATKNSLSKFSKDLWVNELRQLFPNIKSIERIMDDFLFLTLMCGNDYLPSVAYGGIKSTWPFYVAFQTSQQYPKFIVQLDRLNSTLDVDNFKEFLEFLFTNNSALQNQRTYSKTLLQFNRIQPDEYLQQLLKALHNLQTKTFNGHFHKEGWQEKGGPTIFELHDLLQVTNQNIQTKEINRQNNLLVQSPSISAIMLLSINPTEWKQAIPSALHSIYDDYSCGKYSSNLNCAHDQLLIDIQKIPKKALPTNERMAMYCRPAIRYQTKNKS